jgi:oligopeptide transport system ATP-binding protein
MAAILEVQDLVTRFHTLDGIVHALNGVSFALEQGETLAVVGESGSGKSVTMMSLLGLIPSPPGRVEGGKALLRTSTRSVDLLQLSPHDLNDIRGGQIGFVFQDPQTSLNPILTVGRQISESLTRHLGFTRPQARARALELLGEVGIPDRSLRYDSYPFEFSGGMRQRVMIAIAVACNPQIVIADEPTTALDVTIQAQVVDLFKRLRDKLGIAIIWITHDLGVVAGLAERVLVFYGGRVVESAQVDDLYERPAHPYTIGLLNALPRLDAHESKRLVTIEGTPPDLLMPLRHCPFAWRCTRVSEACWEDIPPLLPVGPRHWVACLFNEEKGAPRDG